MSSTTAGVLIRLLEQYGVSIVFGIPGVHTLELYRGLAAGTIQHITPRHEQGAGFMADGYARVSGAPGVCFIISGPGMTNMLTAMGQAYSESVPMLVISSVNEHGRMGSGDGWLHELSDQQAMVKAVCAFSHTLHHPDELSQVLARAFAVFDSQRARPVHIEIPINVLNAHCSYMSADSTNILRLSPPRADANAIIQAAQVLARANKTVLLAGGGAAHASANIVRLAERLDAPVVMTVNARGILPHHHALAVTASASLPAVRKLIAEADVVLGIGTEMGPTDYDFNEDGLFKLPGYFIRIDIDAQQLVRTHIPQLALIGDSASTTTDLLQALMTYPTRKEVPVGDELAKAATSGSLRAQAATKKTLNDFSERERRYLETLACIRDTLPDVIISGDSTQLIYAGNCAIGMQQPSSYFNSAMGFGTLGYALPAAIGAALAAPERSVVAISGDGGLQFCLAELATAVDEKLNLTLIVHRNGGYQEINAFMQANQIEPIGVDLMVPDLNKIATACGWQCVTPSSLELLPETLLAASTNACPTLIILEDFLFDDRR
ncbi:MAG: 5-guanidino-2-oxopentanoate decarboxylase [Granulosicoccus sp.]